MEGWFVSPVGFPTPNRERHLPLADSFSHVSSLIISVSKSLAYIRIRILLINDLLLKDDAVYARFQQCAYCCSLTLQQTQAI